MPLKRRIFHHLATRRMDLLVLVREMTLVIGATSSGSGGRLRELEERNEGLRCCHGFFWEVERLEDARRVSLGERRSDDVCVMCTSWSSRAMTAGLDW